MSPSKPKNNESRGETFIPGTEIPLVALLKELAGRTMDYAPILKKHPELTAAKVRQGLRLASERIQAAGAPGERVDRIGTHKVLISPSKAGTPTPSSPPSGSGLPRTRGAEDVPMGRFVTGPRWETFVDLGLEPGKPIQETEVFFVNVDGCSKGNPGQAAVGVVFTDADGDVVAEGCASLGHMTNNAAEYHGLIAALSQAVKWGVKRLEVRTDSELMVRQMDGTYAVKSPLLFPLMKKAQELRRRLTYCKIRHVPREENVRADELANLAIDRLNR